MIKSEAVMDREVREHMRGGQGQVQVTHLFKPGEFAGQARLVARLTLQPGCSIGQHQHLQEEEIYYVISGTALLCESADDPGTLMQPGDATLARSGTSHAISNPGREPLEVLAVVLLTAPGT